MKIGFRKIKKNKNGKIKAATSKQVVGACASKHGVFFLFVFRSAQGCTSDATACLGKLPAKSGEGGFAGMVRWRGVGARWLGAVPSRRSRRRWRVAGACLVDSVPFRRGRDAARRLLGRLLAWRGSARAGVARRASSDWGLVGGRLAGRSPSGQLGVARGTRRRRRARPTWLDERVSNWRLADPGPR